MTLIIEGIIFIFLFTIMVCMMSKEPIKTLYNYPPKIQEKVKTLEQYKDKIPTNKNMIAAKLGTSVFIVILVALLFRFVNGYETFQETFKNGFILWSIINIYDVIVLDIIWFCHSKRFIFEGTEDIKEEYKNYSFHIKGGMIGELIGGCVIAISGLIVQFIL